MISFIVIGKNIEKTILICYNSIINFICKNNISSYEIIYVDSDSSDKSVELVIQLPINIFSIVGETNAAVGRNEGANFAKGDIYFFIDGDMELNTEFYKVVFDNNNRLTYPFVTGMTKNILYNIDFSRIIGEGIQGEIFNTIENRPTVGGVFLIEKEYWIKLNGMNNRFNTNEDLDFGLRMNNLNRSVQKHWMLIVKHHTISYFSYRRLFDSILSFNWWYRGVLIRNHFLRSSSWHFLIRRFYNVFILLFSIVFLNSYLFLLFIFIITLKSIKSLKSENFISKFLFNFFGDLYTLLAILFFFPKNKIYKIKFIKKID